MGATEDALYREFGRRLREARSRSGATQAALGALLGLSRTSVSNIEAGRQRVPLHYAYTLAGALGCRMSELLPESTKQPYEEVLGRMGLRERQWIDGFLEVAQREKVASAG